MEFNVKFKDALSKHGSTIKRGDIMACGLALGLDEKDIYRHINMMNKVSRGVYSFENIAPSESPKMSADVIPGDVPAASELEVPTDIVSDLSGNTKAFIPVRDPNFVGFGAYKDIKKIIETCQFYPIFISGESGNGKTLMVQQACAKVKREFIRVQINPATDEDDLIGGFRLKNGETVFEKGPVITAMERGAVLLIDEIDRGSNNIMCLQGIAEGTAFLIKKIGELVKPRRGFTIIATANTKGSGDEAGRYSAASIIDEAFLERFVINVEQEFPNKAIESKIIMKAAAHHGAKLDAHQIDHISEWAATLRKAYSLGAADDQISTRRVVHIIRTHAIFGGELKANIARCIQRYTPEVREMFLDIFDKVEPKRVDLNAAAATERSGAMSVDDLVSSWASQSNSIQTSP